MQVPTTAGMAVASQASAHVHVGVCSLCDNCMTALCPFFCCLLACPGVKGIVLEAFGVGNFPDLPQQGWVPWLRQQTRKGLQVRSHFRRMFWSADAEESAAGPWLNYCVHYSSLAHCQRANALCALLCVV
jgi:hypothetical protein